MSFAGKVALISGGAEGIGAAVARLIVARGGDVMLADMQYDKAMALAEELGARAAAVQLDVRVADEWTNAVDETVACFGTLTTLLNVAGISEPGSIEDVSPNSWARTLAINLEGPFHGCRAALPWIVASGEPGAIVNVGSMLALRPGAGFVAYCSSKAGLTTLSKCVALHCAEKGYPVRVNTVHPGAIRTPMFERYLAAIPGSNAEVEAMFAANHPVGRVGEADEVAEAIAWLASDASSFTTGVDLTVDGGSSIRS